MSVKPELPLSDVTDWCLKRNNQTKSSFELEHSSTGLSFLCDVSITSFESWEGYLLDWIGPLAQQGTVRTPVPTLFSYYEDGMD